MFSLCLRLLIYAGRVVADECVAVLKLDYRERGIQLSKKICEICLRSSDFG
jgi:hypothetical protein